MSTPDTHTHTHTYSFTYIDLDTAVLLRVNKGSVIEFRDDKMADLWYGTLGHGRVHKYYKIVPRSILENKSLHVILCLYT